MTDPKRPLGRLQYFSFCSALCVPLAILYLIALIVKSGVCLSLLNGSSWDAG